MTCELHTDIQSRPQLMLNAIMEIRNEIYNAREYGRSALSKKRVPMKKTKKKTPKGAAKQYLNQTTPQTTKLNLKESTDAQKLKDMDKLLSNSVSRNGSVARYKGPKYSAIPAIFTYLACTTGLGFSAVAILQSVFNDTIKNRKQKIKQAIKARNLQYDLNKTTHRRVLHTEEHTTHEQIFGAVHAEVPENIQTIPSIIDTETTQQLLKNFQLIKPENLFPPDIDLSEYIMLAYTKKFELLISKPFALNSLPNYAVYIGRFNTFGNQENNYITGFSTNENLKLDFNDSPVNTIAVEMNECENYDKQKNKNCCNTCNVVS